MSFKALVFQKFASEAREKLLNELKQTYESKKGDRFNVDGTTYEISRLTANRDGLEFEISSKIPVEFLSEEAQLTQFFEKVKNLCCKAPHPPFHAIMEDIVNKLGEREVKKRDYVRLRYRYKFEELYDQNEVLKLAEAVGNGTSIQEVPDIPGVTSLMGRLVLPLVRDNTYNIIKDKISGFIEANEQVRKKLCK